MKHLKFLFTITILFILFSLNAKAQIITTVAGNGTQGFSGDGGLATNAELGGIWGIAVDASGNFYITDGDRIRKVNTSGIISTVAGNGWGGYSGDGELAISAEFYGPRRVAVDAVGNIYIADGGNHRLRKVDTSGIIRTVAGNGISGFSGDGGAATSAELSGPTAVAVDAAGNIYIADGSKIRKVNTSGIISTLAGKDADSYGGDGGLATDAYLSGAEGIAIDAIGNIYIAEQNNNRIRKVNTSGIISTVAGNGTSGYNGDGRTAISAQLNNPFDVAVDTAGNIYIADFVNNRIRKVDTSGIISTVAGGGYGYTDDGGLATNADLNYPSGVAVDANGNIYIVDEHNKPRIRKVTYFPLPVTLASITAKTNNKEIAINWQTATELNTSHFIIQHSIDGSSFTDIGTVKAIGSGANGYQFTDNNPTTGTNYYRLKSVDNDGAVTFSKVVSVNFGGKQSFSIIPNPARDFAKISFSKTVDKATITVYDITGKAVITQSLSGSANSYKLNTQTLTNGVYVIKVNTATGSYNEKLLINK